MDQKSVLVEDIINQQEDSQLITIIFGGVEKDFRGTVAEWKEDKVDNGYVVIDSKLSNSELLIYV